MDKYTIYKHTTPSEKVYIGMTKQRRVEDRWKYGYGYRHNPHFFNAILKYGWDNIDHKIIASDLTLEDACAMEKELIAFYTKKNACYNIAEGGMDGNIFKRTDVEKAHLSAYFKDYWKSHDHPFKGKKHSEEAIQKMRESGRKRWQENYDFLYSHTVVKVKVGVFDVLTLKYKEFETEKEAAIFFDINQTTLRRHVDNGSIYKNYIFIPIDKISFEEALLKAYNVANKNIHGGGQEIPIVQLSLSGERVNTYPSIKQAALETGFSESSIGEACCGKTRQSHNYFWMTESKYLQYKEKGELELVLEDMKRSLDHRKELHGTYILQLTLDEKPIGVYISGSSINRKFGYDSSCISKCCRGKISKAYGYKWKFLTKEEYEEYRKVLDIA